MKLLNPTVRVLVFLHSIFFKLPAGFLITVFLLFAAVMLTPADPHQVRHLSLVSVWARSMLWICGIDVRTRGLERIDRKKQYIFVANHASWVDIAVLIASLPQDLCFLAKTELFGLPLVGACMRRSRQIPIDRKHALAAASRLREATKTLPHCGRSLVLFPEGTRSGTGLLAFKHGAAYIGIQTQIPIVPVGLSGTGALMPQGSAIVRSGTVYLGAGEPLPTEGLTDDCRNGLTQAIRTSVISLVNEAGTAR